MDYRYLKQQLFRMKKTLLLLSCLFVFILSFSQEADENSLLEPISETIDYSSIFENDQPLDLTLKYDITSFVRHKNKSEYLDAELLIHQGETDQILKHIRLKARGNFRKGYCFFPPIYLNFKTDPIKNTDLKGSRKIKLVTHCQTNQSYQNYILKEFLAYKIYNLLTDYSFRVKLVNIHYIDTGKKGQEYHRKGFIIEPLELVARRTNSVEVDVKYVSGKDVRDMEMDRLALFEYLIANTDWRIKSGHNIRYLKPLKDLTSQVIPVPYDFDYSGFVDATYAHPQEWTSIQRVTEREYLGYCRADDAELLKSISIYAEKKEEIISAINNFQFLPEKDRKKLASFVAGFYADIERPKLMLNTLKRECREITF